MLKKEIIASDTMKDKRVSREDNLLNKMVKQLENMNDKGKARNKGT